MPEGSEAKLVSEVIARGISLTFVDADVLENIPNKSNRFTRELPDRWEELHQRWKLTGIRVKGKLLGLEIETPYDKLVGLCTLGLSGTWAWNVRQHRHAKIAFKTADDRDLVFIDQLGYGTFRLKSINEATTAFNKIGWDLLIAPYPTENWSKFQSHSKIASKEVGEFLLEQNTIAGLGNIYRAEALFRSQIRPTALISNIPTDKWALLNNNAHEVLVEAYKHGGSSIEHFEADGIKGKAQNFHKVYGKLLCPEGHKIKKIKQAARTAWFCETCQT